MTQGIKEHLATRVSVVNSPFHFSFINLSNNFLLEIFVVEYYKFGREYWFSCMLGLFIRIYEVDMKGTCTCRCDQFVGIHVS